MSEQPPYPPPGHQPTSAPPPGPWSSYPGGPSSAPPPPPAPGWTPAPGMLGAAHKPGAVPLRPLGLGDIYDAAFKIIRFNPKATVGSAVLVAVFAVALPLALTELLTYTSGHTVEASFTSDGFDDLDATVWISSAFSTVVRNVALILVTGMVAHVTAAAAIGKQVTIGEAWAATAGKRWKLVGLATFLLAVVVVGTVAYVAAWVVLLVYADVLVVVIWGVVSVPAFVALAWFVWIRCYYLPVPALMLEDVGVFGAIRRGYRLTRGQFWRIFGIALLTLVIAGLGGTILAVPFTLGGALGSLGLDGGGERALLVTTQALGAVVTIAFTAPFTSAVGSLLYLDQRMRKEAYDVDLMGQAGVLR